MIKRKEKSHNNNDRWLLTYVDLITLLMIFFVVMYAMSNVDAEKYRQLSASLGTAFVSDAQEINKNAGIESTNKQEQEALDERTIDPELVDAARKLKLMLKENGLDQDVSVDIRERGVVVGLTNTVLFEPGSTDIRSESREMLVEIGKIVAKLDNYIRVEGNTDDVPMNSERFPSNWELSVIRATEVLKLMVSQSGVDPEKVSAVGYGEYRPTNPNTSAENRAKNRKVDIVILSGTYDKSESEHY